MGGEAKKAVMRLLLVLFFISTGFYAQAGMSRGRGVMQKAKVSLVRAEIRQLAKQIEAHRLAYAKGTQNMISGLNP